MTIELGMLSFPANKMKSKALWHDKLMVITGAGSLSSPLPVQGFAHWAMLPCQKSENLEETTEEGRLREKAQPQEKGCCSPTAFSDCCFHWSGFCSSQSGCLLCLILGRTSITLTRSYSWMAEDFRGLSGLGRKSHLNKRYFVNIYYMLGYKNQ